MNLLKINFILNTNNRNLDLIKKKKIYTSIISKFNMNLYPILIISILNFNYSKTKLLISHFDKIFYFKNLNLQIQTKNFFFTKINYIFIIKFIHTSIFINILNSKTNESIITTTINTKKNKDKTSTKYLIKKIFNESIYKFFKKFDLISLHFIGHKFLYTTYIINLLKSFFIIQNFKIYNLVQHNGCRPKKKKRK